MPVSKYFQRRRQHSATTSHRALPVYEWPALGMPWGTAKLNATAALCSRCGGIGTGGCGRTEQVIFGCGFAGVWRVSEEKA